MAMVSTVFESTRLINRLERIARAGAGAGALNPAQWEALRYLGRANRFSRTPAALAAEKVCVRRGGALLKPSLVAMRLSSRSRPIVPIDAIAGG